MLVVLTQRDKRVDSPAPADLYDIGTVSMVHRVMKTPEGNLFVIIMGVSRTKMQEFVQFDPYLRAKISVLPDEKEDETGVDFQALRRTVISQFERIIKLQPTLPCSLSQNRAKSLCGNPKPFSNLSIFDVWLLSLVHDPLSKLCPPPVMIRAS